MYFYFVINVYCSNNNNGKVINICERFNGNDCNMSTILKQIEPRLHCWCWIIIIIMFMNLFLSLCLSRFIFSTDKRYTVRISFIPFERLLTDQFLFEFYSRCNCKEKRNFFFLLEHAFVVLCTVLLFVLVGIFFSFTSYI